MDDDDNPSPSQTEALLIPVAAILLILIIIFLVGIIVLFCVRKLLQNRGIDTERWPSICNNNNKCINCIPLCIDVAEKLDCNTPDSKVCLDNICPTKQQCSSFWGNVFSCYCCYVLCDACKDIQICPNCNGCNCPTCSCPFNCECECTPPQCHEINCICFKINL